MKKILDKCINTHSATKTAEVSDDIKAMGYKYSTRGAISVSISDMTVPASWSMLEHAQEIVDKENMLFGRGYLTDEERYHAIIEHGQMLMTSLQRLCWMDLTSTTTST